MASFRDIVAERRKSGAGIGSSIGTAFTERAKEKLDPRNYLFTKGGMATALFPKLTGYKAKVGSEKIKRNIDSDKISAEPVVQRLDDLNMQFKIVSKNSMSLPLMARDMNVMRQNIVKLVKISGGTPATKADAFFLSANEREKAYEAQFGRKLGSNSPTSARTNTEKSKSFLETIMGLGISDIIAGLLKGGALVAVTKGIGQYINDEKFRKSVNDAIDTLMKNIFGETWAQDLKTGLLALGAGVLAAKLAMVALEAAFLSVARSLPGLVVGAVSSVAFAAAFAAYLATKPSELYDDTEDMKKKRKEMGVDEEGGPKLSKDQINSVNRSREALEDLMKTRPKDFTAEELKLEGTNAGFYSEKRANEAKQRRLAEQQSWDAKNKKTIENLKLQGDPSKLQASPSQVTNNTNARKSIEDYLGRAITDSEFGLLFKATYAESTNNKEEYARVMAVILNRARKTNQTIDQVLYEKNQFESVTGSPKNGNRPSANFVKGPDNRSLMAIGESTNLLSKVSKNLDSFSSANTKAYETEEKGRRVIADLKNAGGQQIGGTIFAENRYASSGKSAPAPIPAMAQNDVNTGNRMNELSKEFERGIREGSGVTNVTNTTNNISKNGGDGAGAIASGSVYDSELAKMFFARPAIS
jgi:hypothetical protein